jgi:hypothetical protein
MTDVFMQPPAGASLATSAPVELHNAGPELNVYASVAALGGLSVEACLMIYVCHTFTRPSVKDRV